MAETNGWIVLDKPLGVTSRAAVDWAARWFPPRTPLGHTGTLDPLATGVLVLGVGRATRLAEYVQQMDKVYESVFKLGATSVTDDSEGPIAPSENTSDPGRERIETALNCFLGVIDQTTPVYSAVKTAGKRAYVAARRGNTVEPKIKTVRIDAIEILDYEYPNLHVMVRCGKGTFIRSIARDLGQSLGCGSYVSELRRLAIGKFTLSDATPWDAESADLLPLDRGVSGLKWETISTADVRRFRCGQTIVAPDHYAAGEDIACFDDTGRFVAVAKVLDNQRLQPTKVLWQWTEE